jgi:hypothetical protein
VVAVGLVAHGSEATALHAVISHHQHSSLHVSPHVYAGYAPALPAIANAFANPSVVPQTRKRPELLDSCISI